MQNSVELLYSMQNQHIEGSESIIWQDVRGGMPDIKDEKLCKEV